MTVLHITKDIINWKRFFVVVVVVNSLRCFLFIKCWLIPSLWVSSWTKTVAENFKQFAKFLFWITYVSIYKFGLRVFFTGSGWWLSAESNVFLSAGFWNTVVETMLLILDINTSTKMNGLQIFSKWKCNRIQSWVQKHKLM